MCAGTPLMLALYWLSPSQLSPLCELMFATPTAMPVEAASYPFALGLTLLVEWPVYASFLGRRRAASFQRTLGVTLAVNLATHPFIFFALPVILWWFVPATYAVHLAVAEVLAPLVEGLLLWRWTPMKLGAAMLVAILSNAVSWTVGAWIYA